jgi:hypothetical protein
MIILMRGGEDHWNVFRQARVPGRTLKPYSRSTLMNLQCIAGILSSVEPAQAFSTMNGLLLRGIQVLFARLAPLDAPLLSAPA